MATKREQQAKAIQDQIDEHSTPVTCGCGRPFMGGEEFLSHTDTCGLASQAESTIKADDKD